MHKGWNCGDFFDEGITNGAGWYSLSKGKVSVGDIGPYQTDVYQLRQCIFVMTLKMARIWYSASRFWLMVVLQEGATQRAIIHFLSWEEKCIFNKPGTMLYTLGKVLLIISRTFSLDFCTKINRRSVRSKQTILYKKTKRCLQTATVLKDGRHKERFKNNVILWESREARSTWCSPVRGDSFWP